MEKIYKKFLLVLIIFVSSFSFFTNYTNALKINIEEKRNGIFNMSEFKLFYKIKYLQYVIYEKKLNSDIYGKNVPVALKIKINKILDNIFLEENRLDRTKKMMLIFKKSEEISKKTENKSIKNTMDYLQIRIALNF